MEDCIRVEQLSKRYHAVDVVKSVNFTVEQGMVFAFLGPNGAGKSTTMNMLSTLLRPSGGKIYIDGLDMDDNRMKIRQKVGIVFQEDVLDRELSVYENMKYRGGLYLKNRKELERRIKEIAGLLSMEETLQKKYGDCSGGQKRMAQIGRALLSGPSLLILDEPTTGLDPVARKRVWNTLLLLKEQLRMTVFYATHYMEEAAWADHVCVIDHGDILFCGRPGKGKGLSQRDNLSLEQLYFHLLEEARL